MDDKPELVDLKTMAKILGISPVTLRQMHLRGVIPSTKMGRQILRFDPAAVKDAVRQNATNKKYGAK